MKILPMNKPGLLAGLLGTIVCLNPGTAAAQDPLTGEVNGAAASATVVIDNLEWALTTNGENMKWPDAVEYCENLELAGHSDWRLPTLDELQGLYDPAAASGKSIRSPFSINDCCLWSGESLVDRAADDGDEIAGDPEMYQWGFMFDGGLPYYAVHIFEDGRALCTRDAE